MQKALDVTGGSFSPTVCQKQISLKASSHRSSLTIHVRLRFYSMFWRISLTITYSSSQDIQVLRAGLHLLREFSSICNQFRSRSSYSYEIHGVAPSVRVNNWAWQCIREYGVYGDRWSFKFW